VSLFADSGGTGARSADVLTLAHELDELERRLGASRVGVGYRSHNAATAHSELQMPRQSWQASA
jgi:hypothetical protein